MRWFLPRALGRLWTDGWPASPTAEPTDAQTQDGGTDSDRRRGRSARSAPITGLTPGSWTWVDFPEAQCRDGTPTGIGVSPSASNSTNLMIFLEGGGACFNSSTCATNPSHFDSARFSSQFVLGIESKGEHLLAHRSRRTRSLDWNMVYVPYCTGDVHAGNAPNATVSGVPGTQQFVGYLNVGLYLRAPRAARRSTGLTRILLAGQSAGGFGAALEYTFKSRVHSAACQSTSSTTRVR